MGSSRVDGVTRTEFRLASGRIAAELRGSSKRTLVVGIPGLSANLRSYDYIFSSLDQTALRMLAFDPRGRGMSERTPAGSYGWPSHARDVIAMADELGSDQFDVIGWSMGAWIAMVVCQLARGGVRRVVLIDGGGVPDDGVIPPVYAALERLDSVYPSRDAFLEVARSRGIFTPWEFWERMFHYELEDVEGGARSRTRPLGPWEDENYRKTQDPYALWQYLSMPTLLLRATREFPGGSGSVVSLSDLERFRQALPQLEVVEIDTDHFMIGTHPEAASAIKAFLEVDA